MAHKKGQGSVRNGRESNSQRLGIKVYGGESIPSDLYYSCLDGNWNADADSLYGEGYDSSASPGDAADLLPEVWVGRAPVKNATQAQLFVNKTLTYEKTPVADYMKNVLLFAEVLFPQDWVYPQETTLDDNLDLIWHLNPVRSPKSEVRSRSPAGSAFGPARRFVCRRRPACLP